MNKEEKEAYKKVLDNFEDLCSHINNKLKEELADLKRLRIEAENEGLLYVDNVKGEESVDRG
jgi:hypothetical protein